MNQLNSQIDPIIWLMYTWFLTNRVYFDEAVVEGAVYAISQTDIIVVNPSIIRKWFTSHNLNIPDIFKETE